MNGRLCEIATHCGIPAEYWPHIEQFAEELLRDARGVMLDKDDAGHYYGTVALRHYGFTDSVETMIERLKRMNDNE